MDRAPKILAFVLVALTCLAGVVWPWVDEIQDVARARAEVSEFQKQVQELQQRRQIVERVLLNVTSRIYASEDSVLIADIEKMGLRRPPSP